jgi:hypothetical protein
MITTPVVQASWEVPSKTSHLANPERVIPHASVDNGPFATTSSISSRRETVISTVVRPRGIKTATRAVEVTCDGKLCSDGRNIEKLPESGIDFAHRRIVSRPRRVPIHRPIVDRSGPVKDAARGSTNLSYLCRCETPCHCQVPWLTACALTLHSNGRLVKSGSVRSPPSRSRRSWRPTRRRSSRSTGSEAARPRRQAAAARSRRP